AEEANRLKDQFMATVSHELRTPLTAILGYARLLRSGRVDQSVLPMALETIERNARLQAQLIDDLLDHSRILAGKLPPDVHPIDLTLVVTAAADAARVAAEAKGIQMNVTLCPTPEMVAGDSGRLQQVISNLLNNALKFTPEGGVIEVFMEASDDG